MKTRQFFLFILGVCGGSFSNAQSNVDSLLKVITSLKQENNTLSDQLASYDKVLPSIIRVKDVRSTDNSIYASFELNKAGLLKVEVYDGINRNPVDEITCSYNDSPIAVFRNLTREKAYYLRSVVVNENGNEKKNTILDYKVEKKLNVKTKPTLPNANIMWNATKIKLFGDHAEVPLLVTNGQPVAIGYILKKVVDNNGLDVEELIEKKELKSDNLGAYSDLQINPSIKLKNLEPNTKYKIEVVAANEFGKETELPLTITTTSIKPELQFVNGIEINYNVLKTIISWKTNSKPKEARVVVKNEDGTATFSIKANYSGVDSSCKAELNYADFLQMNSFKSGTGKLPIILAEMDGGDQAIKQMAFRISFSVPNPSDVKVSNLDKSNKNELTNAIQLLNDAKNHTNKKIKWNEIAKVGLPLVLNFL